MRWRAKPLICFWWSCVVFVSSAWKNVGMTISCQESISGGRGGCWGWGVNPVRNWRVSVWTVGCLQTDSFLPYMVIRASNHPSIFSQSGRHKWYSARNTRSLARKLKHSKRTADWLTQLYIVSNYTRVCGCLCVCLCVHALRIVSPDKILHCINTFLVSIPNKTSKINNGRCSLMTRYTSCNPMKPITSPFQRWIH